MSAIRILHLVLGNRRYGTESVILNLYHHIDRSRYQFDFLVDHKYQNIEYEAEVEALGGHVYRQFYDYREAQLTGYISPKDFWDMHPEIQGGIHYNLNLLHISDVWFIAEAKNRGVPIRLIHSHNSNESTESLYRCMRGKFRQKLLGRYLKSFVNKRLACSAVAGRWNFGGLSCEILPNAIDVDKYAYNAVVRDEMRRQYRLSDKLVLGFVGRFEMQKNPEFLLEILREVNKRCDNAVLVMLGDGSMEDEIKSAAKEAKLNNTLFVGNVDNVHEWMQAFDVLLLPSRYEGLPVALVEAQAGGVACFTSDQVSGEAALTERLSYLSLKDPAAWAEAILRADLSYNRSKGRDGVAAAGYDIRDSARRLEAVYDELLAKGSL